MKIKAQLQWHVEAWCEGGLSQAAYCRQQGLNHKPFSVWKRRVQVDLRRGIDGLSALVQENLGQQPCAESVFVFRNASGNRIKALLWDGNGVWLCQRRLYQGHFIWPRPGECRFSITLA